MSERRHKKCDLLTWLHPYGLPLRNGPGVDPAAPPVVGQDRLSFAKGVPQDAGLGQLGARLGELEEGAK